MIQEGFLRVKVSMIARVSVRSRRVGVSVSDFHAMVSRSRMGAAVQAAMRRAVVDLPEAELPRMSQREAVGWRRSLVRW